MSGEQENLSRLQEQLNGNKAERGSALRELADLDDYSWGLVKELTPVVVNCLSDSDSNALEAKRAGSAFEKFIEAHPDAVAAGIGDQNDLILSEHKPAIEHMLKALVAMEKGNPGFLAGKDLHLSDLLDERSKDIRYNAVRLHGAIATKDALQQLEYVLNQVDDDAAIAGAYDGYDVAVERVVMSLDDQERQSLDIERAVGSLSHIADHRPQLLEEYWQELANGLRTPFHETVADALFKIVANANEKDTIGCKLTATVLEMCEENVQSTATLAARICDIVPEAAQTISDCLHAPSETKIETLVSSVPSGTDGRLLAGLLFNHYQAAAVAGLEVRITTGSTDMNQMANALMDLIEHQSTSDKGAHLLVHAISNQPEAMEKEFSTLYPQLETAIREGDQWKVEASAQVLEGFAQMNPTITDRIADDILTRVFSERDGYLEPIFDVLDVSCTYHSTAITKRIEQIIELVSSDNEVVRHRALDLLGSALDSEASESVYALPVILSCLDDPDPTVQGKAIEAIVKMGVKPAPPELRALSEDDDQSKEVRQRASQAITTIEQYYNPNPIKNTYATTGASVLNDDEGDVELRYWSAEGGWEPLEFGRFRQELIEKIREQHQRSPGTGLPVLLPYYEPSDVIPLAFDFILRSPDDDCQVVLFSPGTQTQWGQKSEVREEIARYGLAPPDSSPLTAARLPDVVPHARISDGESVYDSDGTGPGELVITKQLNELLSLPPDSVDAIIFHLCSRRKDEWEELLQTVDERFVNATTITAYSHFTKNEREHGRPNYGPPEFLKQVSTLPGEEIINKVMTAKDDGGEVNETTEDVISARNRRRSNSKTANHRWILGDSELMAQQDPPPIRIVEIEAPKINSLLEQIFEDSAQLENVEDEGGSYRIFSEQMFFERLPTPVTEYDSWIQDEWQAGKPERFLPDVSEERLNGLEMFGKQVENLEVPKRVFDAENKLRRIRDQLKESNPMFDAIVGRVKEAIQQETSISILVPTPSFKSVLQRAFENRTEIPIESLDSFPISVVTPDTAREINPVQTLLIPGPLHPQHKCYYVHPRADSVEVLTYNRLWAAMVERHANEYVELLNDTTATPDYRPFGQPDLEGDTEPEDDTVPETDEEDAFAEPAESRSGLLNQNGHTPSYDTPKTKMDLLALTMETASDKEYSDSSSRYIDEYRIYEIEFEDGTILRRSNTDTILRRRSEDTGGKPLQWVRPQLLTTGDRVVVIPRETKQELWRERLHELYDEEISPSAVDDLRIWYQTILDIWSEVSAKLGANPSKQEVLNEIYYQVNAKGFERREETLSGWIESVQSAEDPLELAEDPSLTIGPQDQDDIRIIGEAFDESTLQRDYENIGAAMRGLRTVNRNEGREFHDWLLEQVLTDEPNRVNKAAHTEEVVSITDVTSIKSE